MEHSSVFLLLLTACYFVESKLDWKPHHKNQGLVLKKLNEDKQFAAKVEKTVNFTKLEELNEFGSGHGREVVLAKAKTNLFLSINFVPNSANSEPRVVDDFKFASSLEEVRALAEMQWEKDLLKYMWEKKYPRLEICKFEEVSTEATTSFKRRFCVAFKKNLGQDLFAYGFAAGALVEGLPKDDVDKKPGPDEIISLGFSQTASELGLAVDAMHLYLKHPDAFGVAVALPSLYSGYENDAINFFKGKQTDVEAQLKNSTHIAGSQFETKCIRAWVVDRNLIGIFSYWETPSISQPFQAKPFLYYFVVYSFPKISRIALRQGETPQDGKMFVGTFQKDELNTLMTLADYLQSYNLSDIRVNSNDAKTVNTSDISKLLHAADFVAKKHEGRVRESIDKFPYVNHTFAAARIVTESSKHLDLKMLQSVVLHDTQFETNTEVSDIENLFGSDVLKQPGDAKNLQYECQITSENAVFKTFTNPKIQHKFEGRDKMLSLTTLLEGRRKKAYVKQKISTDPPKFTIQYLSAFEVGSVQYGIFNLRESVKNGNEYRFSIHESKGSTYIVGELLECTGSTIFDLVLKDYTKAHQFMYSTPSLPNKSSSTEKCNTSPAESRASPLLSPLDEDKVRKLILCLEFASRKHGALYQRRKAPITTPYINHVIGVATILIDEAIIDDITIILVAILHDTLENTGATHEELKNLFGEDVADVVKEVSDDTTDESGKVAEADTKKKTQKQKALDHSVLAVLVKLADKIHNCRDFDRQRPYGFAENKRQHYFTTTEETLTAYKQNFATNGKNWTSTYVQAYNKLVPILETILKGHKASRNSTMIFPYTI